MSRYFFFTLNDFERDSGGTIRMKGIVNALSESGRSVTLISNAQIYGGFDSRIKHVPLSLKFTKRQKQMFQFCLSIFSNKINRFLFKKYYVHFKRIFDDHVSLDDSTLVFFEYLDNSMALFLNKNNVIGEYLNDTHGCARLEFKYKKTYSMRAHMANKVKYLVSAILDKKHYQNSGGTLFLSDSLYRYIENCYPFIVSRNNYIVRDGVRSELCNKSVNGSNVNRYKKLYRLESHEKVIMFAGNFKESGGVLDLIAAFGIIANQRKMNNIMLLLIGDGECMNEAIKLVSSKCLSNKVFFAGRVPYDHLRDIQQLANVIVCPDRKHLLSEMVPHIKYFDALLSGKVVINGSFRSVREINSHECLSVDFEPSNVQDLAEKIAMVLLNESMFSLRYSPNNDVVCSRHTYSNSVMQLP